MRSLCWIGFLCVLSLGCRPSAPEPAPFRSTVTIEAALIQQAFAQLTRDTFQIMRTLIVLDSSGHLLGTERRIGRYRPDSGLRWLRVEQTGHFPRGAFEHAISNPARTSLASTQALWPDPLPFLQARQRDAYQFQSLSDTMLFGHRLTRLQVLPAGADHAAQKAFQGVLYLEGQQLIGAELQTSYNVLFSTERRYLSVWHNPNDSVSRRLLREQFILEVDPIGHPPYRFCLETQYRYGDQPLPEVAGPPSASCPSGHQPAVPL